MELLILVRHGQTNKNVKKELHAFGDDELLNDVGIQQINKVAVKLKEFTPQKVYFSKNNRALQSGEIIAKTLNIDSESIEGMEERNWGDFAGKNWEEVQKVLDPMTLENRYQYVPPNGESWKNFENRLINAINNILSQSKDKNIVVVSHGGAIRALMPYLLSTGREESFNHNPDLASITIFRHENGKFSPIILNNTEYLKK